MRTKVLYMRIPEPLHEAMQRMALETGMNMNTLSIAILARWFGLGLWFGFPESRKEYEEQKKGWAALDRS